MFCFLCSGKFPLLFVCFFCPLFPVSLFLSAKRLQLPVVILLLCIFSPTRPPPPTPPHAKISIWPSIFNQSIYAFYLFVDDSFSFISNICVLSSCLHRASIVSKTLSFIYTNICTYFLSYTKIT